MIRCLLLACIVHAYPIIPMAIRAYANPIHLATRSLGDAELKRASAKEERRRATRSQLRKVRSEASQTCASLYGERKVSSRASAQARSLRTHLGLNLARISTENLQSVVGSTVGGAI